VRHQIVVEKYRTGNVRRVVFGARVALLRRQIPGRVDNRQAGLAKLFLQPVGIDGKRTFLGHFFSPAAQRLKAVALPQAPGNGPNRIRKRRFSRPFFSTLPIWISPISPVLFTWVPPQGWLSTVAFSPMHTSLIWPVPVGGRTFFDFTSVGLAASSSSPICRMKIG